MRYLGKINDVKDLVTKEYVDGKVAGAGTVTSVNGVEPDSSGNITLAIPSKTSDLTNNSGFLSSVATANIIDKAVTAAKIADSTITGTQIAANAITSAKIASGAVGTNQLATGAANSAVLASNAVITAKITDKAITTAKINDKAVTSAKIGTDVTYSTIGLSASQVRTIYVGTSAPSSSTGSDGDIYLTYS